MKKVLTMFLAVLMIIGILTAMPVAVNAYDSGGFSYNLLANGTYEISEYNGTSTPVTIPSAVNGKPVTQIGDYAFVRQPLTGVVIPSSIKVIGSSAFLECSNLISVTLNNGLEIISDNAFGYCSSLKKLLCLAP